MPKRKARHRSPVILEICHADPAGAAWRTIAKWTDSKQDNGALLKWLAAYRAVLNGKCRYVSAALGYTPYPQKAWIRRGKRTLATWEPSTVEMPGRES